MGPIKSLFVLLLWVIAISLPAAAEPHTLDDSQSKSNVLSYEKRIVLSYLLLGAEENREFQNAVIQRLRKLVNDYASKPVQQIAVTQFSDFFDAYKGTWPNSHSLESDLNLIENGLLRGPVKFHAVDKQGVSNPNLQAEINQFMQRQNREILKQGSSLLSQKLSEFTSTYADLILTRDPSLLTPSLISSGFDQVSKIYRTHIQTIDQIGHQISQSGQLSQMDPTVRLFIETVLQNYFSKLGAASKKQILSRLFGLELNATSMQKFEALLMSGGPQFQKLMQVVAGQPGLDPAFQAVLKKLESKVSPVPSVLVKELFEKERSIYHWLDYDLKALGTGTMAQVHKGSIPSASGPRDVVIRFLKPGIELRVKEDAKILTEIAKLMDQDPRFARAGLPKLSPIVQDLNRTIIDELDLTATILRQKMGREAYNQTLLFIGKTYKSDLRINVPDVIQVSASSHLMVQELVDGKNLKALSEIYKESIPDLEKVIVENLGKLWVQEAIFKSGFFHSDLHPGNFLVDVQDPRIQISILDFGMGGVLSKLSQSQVLLTAAGVMLARADLVVRGYWTLSLKNENQISEQEWNRRVQTRMKSQNLSIAMKEDFSQWTVWAMNQGLKFPYEFVSLNRGFVILEQALKDVKSADTLTDIARRLAPKFARNVYLGWKSENLISHIELARLGWEAVVESPGVRKVTGLLPLEGFFSGRARCGKVYSNTKSAELFDFSVENLLQF